MLNLSSTKLDATVALLSRKTVKVVPTFTNKPEGLNIYNNQVSISPSSVEIAGTEDVLKSLDKIELESVDFTKVKANHNEFDLQLKVPNGCRSLNNTYSAKLKLDMSSMASKKLSTSRFEFSNLSENKKASCSTSNLTVDIIGPSPELKNIKSSNICVRIDLAGKENFTGITELPAKIIIESNDRCWVYGNYSVNVKVE